MVTPSFVPFSPRSEHPLRLLLLCRHIELFLIQLFIEDKLREGKRPILQNSAVQRFYRQLKFVGMRESQSVFCFEIRELFNQLRDRIALLLSYTLSTGKTGVALESTTPDSQSEFVGQRPRIQSGRQTE
jgi:hypothetical protein